MLPLLPAVSLAAATDENLRVLAAIEQGRLEIPSTFQRVVFVSGLLALRWVTRPAAAGEDCQA